MFDPFVQFVASYLAYIENLITSPVFIAVVIFAGGLFIHDLWQRRQEEGWKRRQFDNMVTSLLILFANVLFSQLMVVVSAWLRTGMETIGVPTISASVWDGWPPLLVFFIYLAARDFVDYWNHRFMHMPWLWPIHAVHHSDTDVNVFTAYRVHLLEGLLMRVTHIVALSWMGASPEAIGMIV
ncbi:MAG: sterol desaturase family protein [Pseudomonadota bacterium]